MNERTSKATHKPRLVFGLSVFLGAMIWLLSVPITGHREPWDSETLFYPCALVAAGFIPACFEARRFWRWAVGALLGQVIVFGVLVLRKPGPLWVVGLLFLCGSALLSLAGAAIGAGVHRLLHRGDS